MLGAEGVAQIRIFEHETELSRLKLHEIPTWFSSNIRVPSWEWLTELTRLRNFGGFRVHRSDKVFGLREGLEQAEYL